jgi:hypothetical protein
MKITQHKTVTQSTCLPPEAYIHLWNVTAKRYKPKYKSRVDPFQMGSAKSARFFNDDDFNKFKGIK